MLLTNSWSVDFLIIFVTALFLIYKYFTRHFDFWKNKGVPYPKPVPFFGNFYDILTFKKTVHEIIKSFWDEIEGPYFGIFISDEPALVLKSPKLIKDVLIKDFSIFCDRRVATPRKPMDHSVFFLKYDHWKKVRSKLSPLFTSGMLKNMHTQLEDINSHMNKFVADNIGVMDVRDIGGHFATEMIVRCFYAANPYCFDKKPSLFRKFIHKLFDFNFRNAVIQNLYFLKPSIISIFNLDFIEWEAMDFFKGAFSEAVASKSSYDGKPQNFVEVTQKAVKEPPNGGTSATEMDIAVSNAVFFLIAGQETTSTLISFTLYELAINQVIQDKLRRDIKESVKKHGGLTYEGIQENKYLEMCLRESMRKYPALLFLDRMPISDYRFEGTDLVIKKGTSVVIPFYSLHRDEKYYPDSNKYNPDRFLGDNINADGLNYIPFGEGPRRCIGKRLGDLGVGMAVANIILNFKVEKCNKTPETIEFEPKNFALVSKVGLPLLVTPLQKDTSI